MALRHRLRRAPLEEAGSTERIQRALETVFSEQPRSSDAGSNSGGQGDDAGFSGRNSESEARNRNAAEDSRSRSKSAGPGRSSDLNGNRGVDSPLVPSLSSAVGIEWTEFGFSERSGATRRRSKAADHGSRWDAGSKQISEGSQRGRYARALNVRKAGSKIAVDATLRASRYRVSEGECRYRVPGASKRQDLAPDTRHLTPTLRYKQLSRKSGRLFILAIDASGSMAINRIRQAKGAALSLLKQSYIKRDRVAIVGFRGTSAELLLPPSRSMIRARRVLDSLEVGGGTPLTAGLVRSLEVVKRERSNGETILLIFTDGNANVAAGSNGRATGAELRAGRREKIERELAGLGSALGKAGVKVFVVDTQTQWGSSGDARVLAERFGWNYLTVKSSN